jgi:hypothetical protein
MSEFGAKIFRHLAYRDCSIWRTLDREDKRTSEAEVMTVQNAQGWG